jgi:hypothetical protein
MKSLTALWEKLAIELANWCCTSATKDIETVLRRTEHEGRSFLTITLPSFAKSFEEALDKGGYGHSMESFSFHRGLPRFLGGFLDLVFDRSTGLLKDNPSEDAIYAVRQLTLVYSKMFLPCNPAREKQALSEYVLCDSSVNEFAQSISEIDIVDFRRMSRLLFHDIFTTIDWKIFDGEYSGRHGPGSTADKLSSNGKFTNTTWTRRLESIFPFADNVLTNRHFQSLGDSITLLEPEAEIPVKVISVPKTQRTPRIIAIEPTCMQFAQQAVASLIVRSIEGHKLLSRLIGFSDQTPNQRLAELGSIHGNLATLDLSEASDRVSLRIVDAMFFDYPCLHTAVLASRSQTADVAGEVIHLAKFASMGSALTFPVEAMAFLVMIFLGIEKELSSPMNRQALNELADVVRVYGDDLIVPVPMVRSVIDSLSTFGSRVNINKSFWTGKFRESCGKEFYNGRDVSIAKFRQEYPSSPRQATEVISLVSFRNLLYQRGLWSTCEWLDERIRKLCKHFPVVLPTSPVIGRHSFLGYETQRVSSDLHAPQVKGLVVSAVPPIDRLDGHGALLKYLHRPRRKTTTAPDHLERAGRPRSVNTKTRWASPF